MKNNPYIKKYQFGGEGDPEDPIKSVLNYGLTQPNKPVYGLGGNPYQQVSGGYSWGSGMPNQSMFTQLAPDNKEYAVHTTVPSVTTTSNEQAIKDMEFKGQYSVVPKIEPTTYDKLKNKYQNKGWNSLTDNEKSLYTDMYETGSALTMMPDNVLERTVPDEYWDKIQYEVDREQGILDMQNAVRRGTGTFARGVLTAQEYAQEIMGTPLALTLEALSGRGDLYSALPNLDRAAKKWYGNEDYYNKENLPQNEQLSPSTTLGIENPFIAIPIDITADVLTGKLTTAGGRIGKNIANGIAKDIIASQSLTPNTNNVVMSGFGLPNFNKGYQSFKESNTGKYIIEQAQKAKDVFTFSTKKAKNQIEELKKEEKEIDNWIAKDYYNEEKILKDQAEQNRNKVYDYLYNRRPYNEAKGLNTDKWYTKNKIDRYEQAVAGFKIDQESGGLSTGKNENPFTSVVTTGTKRIPNFKTGEYTQASVSLPGSEIKFTRDPSVYGGFRRTDVTNADVNINQEYIDTQRGNIKHIEEVMVPGSKAYGSSVGVAEAGFPHLSDDLDFLITESDFNKHLEQNPNYKFVGNNGPAKVYDLFDGKYISENLNSKGKRDNPGALDFNVIHENPDGTVRPVYVNTANGGKRSLEVELFRQFFPDEFHEQNKIAIANGDSEIKIPLTAKQLLEKVDGKTKTIIDSYEAGASTSSSLSDIPEHKRKHILRPDVYINYGDVNEVARGQEAYIKSLVGSKGNLGHQFNAEDFADVDLNKSILNEIDFIGDIDRVANDSKRMQLALNDFYIQSSTYSRVVTENSDIDIVNKSMTEWSPERQNAGYSQRGLGLNATQIGNPIPGASGNSYIKGNVQYHINANTESPLSYIQDIKRKTRSNEILLPEEIKQIEEITNAIPSKYFEKADLKLSTTEDVIRLPFIRQPFRQIYDFEVGFKFENFPTGLPAKVMNEISEKTGILSVTRMQSKEIVGNAYYSSVLKKFDAATDALLYSKSDIAAQPKSYRERLEYWKSLPKQRVSRALQSLNDFQRVYTLLDGGMERLKNKLTSIEKSIKYYDNYDEILVNKKNYNIKQALENLEKKRDNTYSRLREIYFDVRKLRDKIETVNNTRMIIGAAVGGGAAIAGIAYGGIALLKYSDEQTKKAREEEDFSEFEKNIKSKRDNFEGRDEESWEWVQKGYLERDWDSDPKIQNKYPNKQEYIDNEYNKKLKTLKGKEMNDLLKAFGDSRKGFDDRNRYLNAIKNEYKKYGIEPENESNVPKNRYGGQNPYITPNYNNGGPVEPVDPDEENKMMQKQINSILSGKPMNTGITITKLSPDEEYTYQQWVKGLTPNLKGSAEDKNYDMRGAWQVGEQPELFYYDEQGNFQSAHPIDVKQQGSIYEPHLFSRNPFTGKSLKGPNHETFMHALEGDIKAGGKVKMDLKTGDMYTYEKGGDTGHSTVEIERSERVYTPDGKLIMETPADAPTHEEGGVKVTLPAGSLVFPKKYYKALDNASGLPEFKKIAKTMLDNAEKAYLRGEPYSSGGKRQ